MPYYFNFILLTQIMKNLRISKKNPSKILKIIEVPHTYRYNPQIEVANNTNFSHFAIGCSSKSKQSKKNNLSSHRQRVPRQSPSRSQHIINLSTIEKNKKIRSRSLNRSQEAINCEKSDGLNFVMKNSVEFKQKHESKDFSPYIKRYKLRESQKLLNFNSISLAERQKKQERQSKQFHHNSSRKKSLNLRIEANNQLESLKQLQDQALENAKMLLNQGQYRKSLLMVKSILKNKPEHIEALYLSAVNWYHLQDRTKAIHFLQKLLQNEPNYSAECYKIMAVCYFKSLQYGKSLIQLQQCHKYFPEQSQSYDLEGKIYLRLKKWSEAFESYTKAYQFSKNLDYLTIIASCLEQQNRFQEALQYYERAIKRIDVSLKTIFKKMKIHVKMMQFKKIIDTYLSINVDQKNQKSKQKAEIYYLTAYAYYKLKLSSHSIAIIEQGKKFSDKNIKFNKLLLMIHIQQRDIYQAFHIVENMVEEPETRVMMKFVQGVINLMRRNFNDGISVLLSIENDLGIILEPESRFSSSSYYEEQRKMLMAQPKDQFLKEIKHIYLMFLSYGYFCIGEFHSCRRFIEMQKEIGVPNDFEQGITYNYHMCQGIIQHCQRKFKESQIQFLKAKSMHENKLEPTFSLAINYIHLMSNSVSEDQKTLMICKAKGQFEDSKRIIGRITTNTAASVYYFSSLLSAYLQDWKEALMSIDQSIDRSQDHYWRYFYVRGMLLSCIHSFREAINDLSVAVSLSGSSKPECYLLRSKCLQIQGEGNEAFKDLQQYISLKPDDPQVHKYAGQLLFENGAFQDAITAFGHQKIPQTLSNFDIFMTQAKSYFLLGRFLEAQQCMAKAYELKQIDQIYFDIKVFQILESLVKKTQPIIEVRNRVESLYASFQLLGKIFKRTDYYVIKAICYVIEELYDEAIDSFSSAVRQKAQQLSKSQEQDQTTIKENKKDIQNFDNQMRYNISLCHLASDRFEQALNIYQTITIDLNQPFYSDFINFRRFISRDNQTFKKDQVFPSKNKLSNFLEKVKVKVKKINNQETFNIELKLCVPFPKVEPPQIFPTFDTNLLLKLSVLNVQKKPEAPWIIRQNNSIKFTQNIQTYSRFQLQDSESDSVSTYQMIEIDKSHISHSRKSQIIFPRNSSK